MKNAVISGTGSYLPERQLTNKELEKTLDTSDEWIVTRTGISSRHIAAAHETTSFMASQAALKAVEASGLSAEQIDLIVVATCTPDHFFPSMACHVQHALQVSRPIPAFDVSAACSGFVYALDIAKQYISSGTAQHVLVVGSESMSRAVDWTDRSTCVLFGDGAGAVVLSASDEPGILGSVLHASYDESKLLTYATHTSEGPRPLIGMRGNEVFKIAVNIMGDIVDEILAASNLQKSDIKWLVPHQANIRIIQGIAKKLSLPMSQVIVTIEHQGNTSAASIPLALDVSIREQRINRGDLLLLESFGGGMTWGAMVIRY
ncbi:MULTISPECIES: beta-ketoacyl-ACP synthase III [Legionella]|uniref:Beta-ketoacyl-[acyl-carrier-protein] synthase III n=1 Tax=Legionella septentrionalis TaxID=2498109 RepID=A0A3S0VMF1_9GAMM|nr:MULTISPECIES: beta-ketoacyl-ACP synthase III [Legionella]MCP0914400.1 ketoacyl-ACP synthase III [Legionella sp. 27cVA30]RUQ81883.1 ketoacyl-ACP synthase III [Legionella septentrionalis]RUR00253.1 ketoacyl-ACP synthase III [Legionella septentrionalis]RUR09410.1 ketoacyl-ACP synthase III [Legionella septentrionalis]RUR17577.1 ketoacyl-ACP synthase III [Legionella septentrionalis]